MDVPARGHANILIVDDNPEDRVTFTRYLSTSARTAYTVSEAETQQEGLEQCAAVQPDCVLVDYLLPDGDGIEFLADAEKMFPAHAFATVLLTGHGSEEVAAEALRAGATDYLPKGRITAESLCRTVHRAREKADLQRRLQEEQAEKDKLIEELQNALAEVKQLSGLLPICSHCKSIRDDQGYWQRVEQYFSKRTGALFSHGLCPDCLREHYGDL